MKEANTLCTERVHSNHLKKLLGRRRLNALTAGDLQERYINKRGQQPDTIRKELGTLRMVWNLAAEQGKVSSRPPMRGLKYPKGKQKPPFQTWEQIEQAIKRGKLDDKRQRELWDCLFLEAPDAGCASGPLELLHTGNANTPGTSRRVSLTGCGWMCRCSTRRIARDSFPQNGGADA